MSKYITKQRQTLLAFLEENTDRQMTAREIADGLAEKGISVSAVYRNLSELEAEGKMQLHSHSGSREVYYQFVGATKCRDKLHLSCQKCGKTCHVSNTAACELAKLLEDSEDFALDKGNTVLFGLCKECAADSKAE